MVSLLVKKADEVLEKENIEWKYTKIQIYLEYFENYNSVPPPFNFVFILTSFLNKWFSKKFNFLLPDFLVKKTIFENSETSYKIYQKLLLRIFRRYKSTKFYHYRTIQRIDSEEKKDVRPLMTFMNAHSEQEDIWLDLWRYLKSIVPCLVDLHKTTEF